MPKTKRIQVNVDEEVYKILDAKASETGTTLNNVIRVALGLEIKPLRNGRPRINS
jgi:predicted HicB family RNase H-like nuclease